MTSPTQIKAALNSYNGVAQPCHYICTISPPAGMRSRLKLIETGAGIANKFLGITDVGSLVGNNTLQHISMMAESAEIPGRQFATTPHKIYGNVRQMPYGVLYDNINIDFICTNYMIERSFFDVWHQYIMSPTNQYMEYYNDYVGQIIIQKIANDSSTPSIQKIANKISTYTIEEAYPVSIQPQELSYDSDGYLKLSVEFAYARWTSTLDNLFPGSNGVDSPFFDFPKTSIFDMGKNLFSVVGEILR